MAPRLPKIPEPFGVLLKRFRGAAPLTQQQLAASAQLSTETIRALESGRRRWPRPDSVRRLASVLGLEGAARTRFVAAAQLGHDVGRPILVTGATGQQVGAVLRYLRAHSINQALC